MVSTASTSWFIPLRDSVDKTDQPLKEVQKHCDIIEDSLQQWHNSVTKCSDYLLSDQENKENHVAQHVVSYTRSSESISLQVVNRISFCSVVFLVNIAHVMSGKQQESNPGLSSPLPKLFSHSL